LVKAHAFSATQINRDTYYFLNSTTIFISDKNC